MTAEVCNPSIGEDEAGGWQVAECTTDCLPSASTVPPGEFLGTVSGAKKCPKSTLVNYCFFYFGSWELQGPIEPSG